jgi:DNA-binding NarL/FixJ family response regulator
VHPRSQDTGGSAEPSHAVGLEDHALFEQSGVERASLRRLRPVPLTQNAQKPQRDRRLTRKKLDVLERVLLRGGQKPVAAELGLAPSTVAIISGNCLRAMGLECGASRTPLALALAVHALYGRTDLSTARLSQLTHRGTPYTIMSAARPDQRFADELSPAELAVTRLLIEGMSHAQIGVVRHTSLRTVANQLASAFHKLGVSGRCELVCRLLAPRLASEPPPCRRSVQRTGAPLDLVVSA